MAKATPTPEIPTPAMTVADVQALADRFERDAVTSRPVDWPLLQVDMVLGARFLRALTTSREPAEVVDIRDLAAALERNGTTKRRPDDWEAVQETLQSGVQCLRELTAAMNGSDAVRID